MKVGIISDVHSNACALKTCIDYMIKEGCKEFLLLGDYVSDTAQPKETMELLYTLMKKYPCHALRGNREDYLIAQRKVLRGELDTPKWIKNSASGNLLYTYELLDEKDLDFFETLPISFVYEKEGYPSVLCCHGSPDNTRKLLYPEADDTREVLEQMDTDYIVAAHTHHQGVMHYQGKIYVNPGSLGIAIGAPGIAQCAMLVSKESEEGVIWEPVFLNLPYDRDYVVQEIFSRRLYEYAPWFLNNNLHILLTGIDKTPDLVEHAMRLQTEETGRPAVWPYIEEKYFAASAQLLGIPDYGNVYNKRNKY